MELNGIQRAIDILGSKVALAKALKVSPQFIQQLANGIRPVPARLCKPIESATQGQVTCRALRPDIFGEAEPSARVA